MAILLSEGFESGTIGQFDEAYEYNGGHVTIGSPGIFGNYCLVGTTVAGQDHGRACVYKSVSATYLHQRAYIQVPQAIPDGGLTVMSMVLLGSATVACIRFRNVGGVDRLEVVYQTEPGGPYHTVAFTPETVLDPSRVYLLELSAKIGPGNGEIHAWLDEQEVVSVTGLDNSAIGMIDNVRFGNVVHLGDGGAVVLADECAIGDSYIGPVKAAPPPTIIPWILGAFAVAGVLGVGYLVAKKR